MGYLGLTPTTAQQNYLNIDDISGSFDGSTTSFALQVGSVAPTPFPVTNSCLISVGGVIQEPDDTGTSGFRISGGNIVFSSAPGTGEDFFGLILAGADYLNIGANFPDGTVGTPSITFDSDTNTGIYHPSADELSFVTGGSDRVRVDSNGRLGIGTTSPGSFGANADNLVINDDGNGGLTIASGSSSAGALHFADGTTGDQAYRGILKYEHSNDRFLFGTAGGTTALTIDSSQRVGIGVTSPSNALHISTSDNTPLKVQSTAANSYINFVNSNNGQGYIGYEVQDMNFYTANSERMRIDSSGRLLVASTTSRTNVNGLEPRIQVEGINNDTSTVALISNNTSDGTAAQLHLCKSSSGTVGSNGAVVNNELLGRVSFDGSDGTNFIAGAQVLSTCEANAATNDMTANLRFYVNNGGSSPVERFRVSATGEIFHYANEYAHTLSTGSTNASVQAFRVRNGATSMGGGTTRFAVNADGDCENTNNRYTGFSDVKLKENIVDAGSQWDDIKALQVRKYNYKEETGFGTHTQIGLIAQEVELVSPGLIGESKDRETYEVEYIDENGDTVVELKERDAGTVTKSVAYSVLYMKSVKALQEAMTRIETLEAKVAALEAN